MNRRVNNDNKAKTEKMIYSEVFENKVPVSFRLLDFGFQQNGSIYTYSCQIMNGQFDLIVQIASDGQIKTQVIDPDTGDEYRLHLSGEAAGSFVGKLRTDYLRVLRSIADKCFETQVFQSEYACQIIRRIYEKYQDKPEYLWEKFPQNAVVRRSDNKKWYAAFLTVEKNKIGLDGHEKIEIIDLRMSQEELDRLVDGKKYFLGYHMNKKHWVTICLDGSVDLREILDRIDDSYLLAGK